MNRFRTLAACILTAVICACGVAVAGDQLDAVDDRMNDYDTFIPKNKVEIHNYERAQKLFDDPSTIIWCTTTWGNASAPLVTMPVAGKLTSSTVSVFATSRAYKPGDDGNGEYAQERRSIDGMYHGTPPPYRYGFTPGGQYVEFFNMPTLCTTALTKLQRQKTEVALTVDDAAAAADSAAEAALRRGDKAGAQRILEQALPEGGQ